MAGGKGERLWPVVRADRPKVCVSADGRTTLLEATLKRLRPLARTQDLLIITTQEQLDPIRRHLPRMFHPSLLAEPEPRNTAACIALAAGILAARDPRLVMVVLPADHWIPQTTVFQRSLRAAIEAADDSDRMVMIGVRPTRVHSGLGHLCVKGVRGREQGCRVFRLARFVEKPSRASAQRLMRQHTVYWNAGIFVGRVTTFLTLIQRWLPDHARHLFPLGTMVSRPTFWRRARAAYREVRPVSFDTGVMAHVHDGDVIEGAFQWEDLGSWDSWMRVNRLKEPGLSIASRNVRVLSPEGHLVAAVGLEDAIIVQTTDATLVCRGSDAQAVRHVVARLSQDTRLSRYL